MNKDLEKEYHSVLLGALLHDVGKLYIQPEGKSEDHPSVGAELMENYQHPIKDAGFDYGLVDCLIRNHHQRDQITDGRHKIIAQIMSCADGCSAGERTKKDKAKTNAHYARYNPLASLFAHIELKLGFYEKEKRRGWRPETFCHKPKKLDWKRIFPDECIPINELPEEEKKPYQVEIKKCYQTLQEQLKAELTKLFQTAIQQNPDISRHRQAILTSLYSLFYKYFWSVPDDVGRERVDISLFDHTRITAALTAALYLYQRSHDYEDFNCNASKNNQEAILLIKGDLSGIQDYIFNIANIGIGGVAKRLRARSFFLSTLVKVISHKILQESVPGAQLPVFCKIIASGGNFIIVAPNLEPVREKLACLDRSINEWLFREFQGDLLCSMAWLPVKTSDLELDKDGKPNNNRDMKLSRITGKLIELNELLEEKKQRKLSAWLLKEENSDFSWDETAFIWKEKSFPNGLCRSCKKNPAARDPETAKAPEDAFCRRCNDDRKFSETFVKPPKYIAFKTEPHTPGSFGNDPFKKYSFFDTHLAILAKDANEIPSDSYLVLCMRPDDLVFNHPSFLQPQANYVSRFENETALNKFCDEYCEKEKKECDYYQCITGSDENCKDSIRATFPAVKPFDCLARSVDKNSEKLLGILKADVDWLGMLFSQGLGKSASLSRIASLSRMMDLFFTGWLTEFLHKKIEFQDTYTVYAGGDDLFLVSSWEKAVDLAKAIAEDFQRYVACNPEITISAGIAVTKPKFPIAKSAYIANDHLEKVKKGSKNGLHLFGITSNWFQRYPHDIREHELNGWTELFKTGINDKVLSKSVMHKLLQFSGMANRWFHAKPQKVEDLRYISLASYIIGRDIEGNNPGVAERKMAKKLREMLSSEEKKRIFAAFMQPITRTLLSIRNSTFGVNFPEKIEDNILK